MLTFEKASDPLPIPEKRKPLAQEWPFKDMAVGDMVRVAGEKPLRLKAQSYAHIYGAQSAKQFATKTIDGILHVWRVS